MHDSGHKEVASTVFSSYELNSWVIVDENPNSMHPAPIHAASNAPIHIASTPATPVMPAPNDAASTADAPALAAPVHPAPAHGATVHVVASFLSNAFNTVEERRFQRRVKRPQEIGALAPAKLA